MTDTLAGARTEARIDPPPEDALVGRLLDGRYRIVARLGAGGMGIVYEAKHEVLNTRLAIKVLRREAASDEEALERSRREAQAASAIGSEHIVDVRDFGRLEDGSTYVVMELIEGNDLFSIVRVAPIPWQRACRVAAQVCDALFAAHGQGIIHRDLKLENVLLTVRRGDPDFVKIVDFGIAKVQGNAKITAIGRVIGTPEYMSPEQCAGRGVDHRTDIYSLGVMLYEMVTGTLPFQDEDLLALVRKQMCDAPPPPASVRPDLEIPAELEAIILRCLAKEKDARFQTMEELAQALRALPGVVVERAAPPSVPIAVAARPTTASGPMRAARTRWVLPAVALGALGVIAGIAAVGVVAFGTKEPDAPELAPAGAPVPAPEVAPAEPTPAPEEPARSTAVDPPPGITVESVPEAVRVFDAEGAVLGDTPLALPRPAEGERIAIELRADGYVPQPVVLSRLSAERVRVRLERRPTVRRPIVRRPRVPEHAAEPASRPASPAAPPPRRSELRDPWD